MTLTNLKKANSETETRTQTEARTPTQLEATKIMRLSIPTVYMLACTQLLFCYLGNSVEALSIKRVIIKGTDLDSNEKDPLKFVNAGNKLLDQSKPALYMDSAMRKLIPGNAETMISGMMDEVIRRCDASIVEGDDRFLAIQDMTAGQYRLAISRVMREANGILSKAEGNNPDLLSLAKMYFSLTRRFKETVSEWHKFYYNSAQHFRERQKKEEEMLKQFYAPALVGQMNKNRLSDNVERLKEGAECESKALAALEQIRKILSDNVGCDVAAASGSGVGSSGRDAAQTDQVSVQRRWQMGESERASRAYIEEHPFIARNLQRIVAQFLTPIDRSLPVPIEVANFKDLDASGSQVNGHVFVLNTETGFITDPIFDVFEFPVRKYLKFIQDKLDLRPPSQGQKYLLMDTQILQPRETHSNIMDNFLYASFLFDRETDDISMARGSL